MLHGAGHLNPSLPYLHVGDSDGEDDLVVALRVERASDALHALHMILRGGVSRADEYLNSVVGGCEADDTRGGVHLGDADKVHVIFALQQHDRLAAPDLKVEDDMRFLVRRGHRLWCWHRRGVDSWR